MKSKLSYLEGMRALMVLNVILCHFVCVYYPEMYFTAYKGPLSCFATTPLSALVNGNIAVVFFFVLTGFLVGRSTFLKEVDIKLIRTKSVNRYLRLLPVVVIVTAFTFVTMKLGLQYHLAITNENVNMNFLYTYCNFEASLGSLISNSLFWPFVDYSAYVGPFWTISYELWGYIIVLLTAYVLKDSRYRRIIYFIIMVVMVVCLDAYYSIFVLGLFVADLAFNKNPTICDKFYKKIITNKVFLAISFCASVYFACCPMYEDSVLYSFWYKLPILNHILLRGFGMALFVWVSANSTLIQKILSVKPLVRLGEVSFETYALHWPLMLSCEAGLFLLFSKSLSYNIAVILSFVITLIIIYVTSILLHMGIKRINKIIDMFQRKFTKNTSTSL